MVDLPHVASRVFGTPLMIARPKLETILSVLGPRLAGSALSPLEPVADPPPRTSITVERIAVVSVIGTLVSRSGYLDAASGLSSYAEIGEAIAAAMADPSVRGVVLDVDSAGGEVGGLFDLVEQIGAIKSASVKPLWAVANESALSAAYAIASAAERVYVTRTGEIGSVGVVAVHVDESCADTKAGLAWTFVFAGERKIDGNTHEPLSERARAAVQADVDRLYAELCALVAANRGLTSETVRSTQAVVYRGELAIRAGLADRIGTLDLAIAEMATELDRSPSPVRAVMTSITSRSPSMAIKETEATRPTAAEPLPPSQMSEAVAKAEPKPALAPPPAATATAAAVAENDRGAEPTERLRAEFAEIAAVAAQALRLGVAARRHPPTFPLRRHCVRGIQRDRHALDGRDGDACSGRRRHRLPARHHGHFRDLWGAGKPDRDRQHRGLADLCPADRPPGRQRHRREDGSLAAASEQASAAGGQNPHQ
jgi:signal peptide peptidase SppA